MDIGQLLGHVQTLDQLLRGHDPSETQSREQYLGEGAEIDDLPRGVRGLERRGRPLAVEERAVEPVLHDGKPVARGDVEQATTRRRGHGQPGRIVRTRLAVEKLGRLALEEPLEMLHGEPPARHRHRQQLGAEGPEDLHGPRVGRLLDGHEVAGVQERARDQIEALLGAVDDQNVLGPRLEAKAQEIAGEILAQGRVAARRVVLEQLAPFLADDPVEHATEGIRGEQRAVGNAARERDDAGPRSGALAPRLAAARVGGHDLRGLGEKARPLEPRGRRRGGRGGRRGVRDEGALPHVRARPATGHEILVRLGDRGAIHAELLGELARGGKLDAGREQTLADQPLEVQLDLPGQGQPAITVRRSVERDFHGRLVPAIIDMITRL